jgi:hypothetical protein
MRTPALSVAAGFAALVAACGAGRPRDLNPPPPAGPDLAQPLATDDALAPPGGDGGTNPDNVDPGVAPGDCTDGAKLVYVVDENNLLSSFDPTTLKFKDIGMLACPSQPGATPFSMGIDRNATAWVLYSSGELFQVDTKTANCKASKFTPGQQGFTQFGMGFVSNAAGSSDETLFASSTGLGGGNQLGTIDMKTFNVKVVGALGGSPELTGTGDAKLWGFFPDAQMPRVAQIAKNSGAESNVFPLQAISGTPLAWAFAHWGGDFWIFLKRSGDPSTKVHHLRPAIKQLTTPLPNTGRTIVGAGVSTCAPTTIM